MKYLIYVIATIAVISAGYLLYSNYYGQDKNKSNNESKVITNDNSNSDELANIKKEYKIIAFGDSLTAGYGLDLKDSYPSILEEKLNADNVKLLKEKNIEIKVINMGISGDTTSGGLDRVDFLISQQPDLVLLGLGANDMLRGTDPSVTRDNLESIIKKIKDNKIDIILLGMQSQVSNGLDYKRDFDSIYKDMSKRYDIPLVPFFLKGVALMPSLNIDDGIHPNRTGYEKIINDNIMPILSPLIEDNI